MLSGKPPRPWKRSRRRGISVARIATLVLVLAAAGAYALWRVRPMPLPWHALGPERITTPAVDFADADTRRALRWLRQGLLPGDHEWLGNRCTADDPDEIYQFSDDGVRQTGAPWMPRRIIVSLQNTGEIVDERWPGGVDSPPTRTRRFLDANEAEAFRQLLIEGRYASMPPSSSMDFCHGAVIAMESCIRGRYYGVLRMCENPAESPSLKSLGTAISAFAEQRGPAAD